MRAVNVRLSPRIGMQLVWSSRLHTVGGHAAGALRCTFPFGVVQKMRIIYNVLVYLLFGFLVIGYIFQHKSQAFLRSVRLFGVTGVLPSPSRHMPLGI